jgi:uncharacterized membrane protein
VSVNLKIWELISMVLSTLVTGVFWGPWVALSRSISTFAPEVFVAIANRLSRNIAPVLMPAALLSMVPALFLSFNEGPRTCYLTLAGFALFLAALLVTIIVEVPIVKQIETWRVSTLPGNW